MLLLLDPKHWVVPSLDGSGEEADFYGESYCCIYNPNLLVTSRRVEEEMRRERVMI